MECAQLSNEPHSEMYQRILEFCSLNTSSTYKLKRTGIVKLVHQQKLNLLHYIYLVYCTHKLKQMKSRFAWNMALHYCSTVFFESSWCCFQVSWLVYTLLRIWQQALDEQFTLRLEMNQSISRHTPISPNSMSPHDYDSTHSIQSIMRVLIVSKDPHGSIWPIIVTTQKWFMIFNLLIDDRE